MTLSCKTHSVPLLSVLLKSGADVNTSLNNTRDDVIADSPITFAVSCPADDVTVKHQFIKALLEAGSDVNETRLLTGRKNKFCQSSPLSLAIGKNVFTTVIVTFSILVKLINHH